MADKTIVLSDKEQADIKEILIDKDEKAALKVLDQIMHRIEAEPGHVCGPRSFK
jgi:hypothetical protein